MHRTIAGFRSTRRTKIIATIGPATCSEEMLEIMAVNGMNVARLNMSHGTHEWHSSVIERIRKLNKTKGCVLPSTLCVRNFSVQLSALTRRLETGSCTTSYPAGVSSAGEGSTVASNSMPWPADSLWPS